MKTIDTLVDDIYSLLSSDKIIIRSEDAEAFGHALANKLVNRLSEARGAFTLRLSNLGSPCLRKLWYEQHSPELGEKLPGPARFKFLFGDIIEEFTIFLARLCGHTVTDEQKEVSIDGVKGHIDGRIDGVLADVKSASTASYQKFRDGLGSFKWGKGGYRQVKDSFGYLTQLSAYGHAEGENQGAFVVIDKTLGNIQVATHELDTESIPERIQHVRAILANPEPPPRAFDDESEGASGNRKLCMECSYCAFKQTCWPSLRTFLYKSGTGVKPVHLTVVKREPKVPEAERNSSPTPFEE